MDENRSVLAEACVIAMTDIFSDTERFKDLPEHQFSEKFERDIRRIKAHIRKNKYHSLTRPAKIILVAAIIALLATLTVSAAGKLGFSLVKVDNGAGTDIIFNGTKNKLTEDIVCEYIPDGFTFSEKFETKIEQTVLYIDNNEVTLRISKYARQGIITVDSETREPNIIEKDGITYIITASEKHPVIVWLNPETKYYYLVSGDIGEDNLLKVAYNTK